MLKTWIVYNGGRQEHASSVSVARHVRQWFQSTEQYPQHPSQHAIIPDHVAQTIAAWWADSSNAYTTMLATSGKVDRYTTLSDFGTPEQVEDKEDKFSARCLRALGAYIDSKINGAESGSRPCACGDCPNIAVGIPGELCSECAEWGCDATEQCQACEVPSRYCDGCGASGDCDCVTLPRITRGESSQECLDAGLNCSIDPASGACTECGTAEDTGA